MLERVAAAVAADNDNMIMASHVAERGGEIVGAASLAVVPLAMIWNRSDRITARDSMHLKRIYDAVMETKGFPAYWIACNKNSPYSEFMERMEFRPIWETKIFVGGAGK